MNPTLFFKHQYMPGCRVYLHAYAHTSLWKACGVQWIYWETKKFLWVTSQRAVMIFIYLVSLFLLFCSCLGKTRYGSCHHCQYKPATHSICLSSAVPETYKDGPALPTPLSQSQKQLKVVTNSTAASGTASGWGWALPPLQNSYAHTAVLNDDIILPDSSTHTQGRKSSPGGRQKKGEQERGCLLAVPLFLYQCPLSRALYMRGKSTRGLEIKKEWRKYFICNVLYVLCVVMCTMTSQNIWVWQVLLVFNYDKRFLLTSFNTDIVIRWLRFTSIFQSNNSWVWMSGLL